MKNVTVPKNLSNSQYWVKYDKDDVNAFYDNLITKEDIKGKSLYFMSKTASQTRLRDAGFTIKRTAVDADVIVISDARKLDIGYGGNSYTQLRKNHDKDFEFEFLANSANEFEFVLDSSLHQYTVDYVGDYNLYKQVKELIETHDHGNVVMAVEFIMRANWKDNELYLAELFCEYSNIMRGYANRTVNSTAFKGFVSSLKYTWDKVFFRNPKDYKKWGLLKTEEHYKFVKEKFKGEFEQYVRDLCERHNVKIDKLEFSLNMEEYNEEEIEV